MSVFEEAEAEEAERQRRTFLAATYGVDGRRARERLSIGGQSIHAGQGRGLRRESLILWESVGMFREVAMGVQYLFLLVRAEAQTRQVYYQEKTKYR